MPQESRCSQCDTPLSAGSPGRLCPKCLLQQGLAANTAGFTADEPEAAARWSPPKPEELATRFPELEIIELIGRGGMGAVYKARQKNLDRLVALKILPPEIGRDPAFAERFAREAQALARLSHPHIVAIHDFGQRDGLFFFLMEYIDGLNLRQLLDSGTVAPKEALAIVPQICDALQFAHDQGIVHRDIKPENILLDRRGQVKIADFGLAKLMGRTADAEAVTEKVMGTPQYMAPEQVEHPKDVDHRADIYSLGVVFYQMLTGELPLGRFEPPSHKVLIDVRLDEVVLRALEKEPGRRYQQASQVKTEVETIVETSVTGRPAQEYRESETKGDTQLFEDTKRALKIPALGLMVVGAINSSLFLCGLLVVTYFFGMALNSIRIPAGSYVGPKLMLVTVALPVILLGLLLGIYIMWAAARMKKLRNHNSAVIACVVAIILLPGTLLGLALGIWALVVLNRREVQSAFAKQKRLHEGTSEYAGSVGGPAPKRSLLRYLALGCGVIFILALVSLFFLGKSVAPDFIASATLRVDPGSAGSGGLPDKQLLDQFITTQLSQICSRDVLEEALDPAHADHILRELSPDMFMMGPEKENENVIIERVRRIQAAKENRLGLDDPVGRLYNLLQVNNIYRTILIKVSFKSRDPQFAADIVNSVVESYLLFYQKQLQKRENLLLAGLVQNRKEKQQQCDAAARAMADYKREHPQSEQSPEYLALQQTQVRAIEDLKLLDGDIERTKVASEISANHVSVARWASVP